VDPKKKLETPKKSHDATDKPCYLQGRRVKVYAMTEGASIEQLKVGRGMQGAYRLYMVLTIRLDE
jgi:hypothetical protein